MEMSMQVSEIATFTDVLRASGRSPEIPEAADAYGRLVGSWELDCRRYAGEPVSIEGEAHFGWALEGRAIQDVWIMPIRSRRGSVADKTKNMYGTNACGILPSKPGESTGGIPFIILCEATLRLKRTR